MSSNTYRFFYVVKFFSSIPVCKYCTATFCANMGLKLFENWLTLHLSQFYAALSSTNIISLTNVKRSDKCNMALLTLHLSPLVASLLASHWIYFCAQNIDLFIYLTEADSLKIKSTIRRVCRKQSLNQRHQLKKP